MKKHKQIKTAGKIFNLVLAVMLLALVSCNFFRAPGRDDCDKILGREQMVNILTDIYLYESFVLEYQHMEPSFRDSARYHYAAIFRHHEVHADDFDEALDCYLLDRREMDAIHEEMLNRLSIMESEAQQVEDDALEEFVPDVPISTVPDSL